MMQKNTIFVHGPRVYPRNIGQSHVYRKKYSISWINGDKTGELDHGLRGSRTLHLLRTKAPFIINK